jgi:hypothetical protein
VSTAVELVGFGLVLVFLWFVWPPLVLLGTGVLLVLLANARPWVRLGRRGGGDGK